jgi:RIO kinase 1
MIDLNEFEDYEQALGGRLPRKPKPQHKPKQARGALAARLFEADERGRDEMAFAPSVNATSEELVWIGQHLAQFYHGKLIKDVARRVKGGKEANVYCCLGHPDSGHDLIAAKLYRPRQFRSLKNAAQYQQGRVLLDGQGAVVSARDWRLLKAIAGKSRKGVQAAQTSWLMYEFSLMKTLHDAGADVPEPLKHNEYALLMEYVGDSAMAAPALIDVTLEAAEARPLCERLIWNIELMLQCGWIHGDLSAYNVLYWEGQPAIIDFPQVVSTEGNPEARALFRRDVERVCQYFARYGVRSDAGKLAADLWRKHVTHKGAVE